MNLRVRMFVKGAVQKKKMKRVTVSIIVVVAFPGVPGPRVFRTLFLCPIHHPRSVNYDIFKPVHVGLSLISSIGIVSNCWTIALYHYFLPGLPAFPPSPPFIPLSPRSPL